MKISLIEIEEIENWLIKRGSIQDRLITEAKMLSSPEFKEKVHWQSTAYDLINRYGREKLHQEIKAVEYELFHSNKYRSFQDRILSIFKL